MKARPNRCSDVNRRRSERSFYRSQDFIHNSFRSYAFQKGGNSREITPILHASLVLRGGNDYPVGIDFPCRQRNQRWRHIIKAV